MSEPLPEIQIPDRPAFRASDVCELLKLQPYVLRSWENEFKDLGVSKTPGGPRIYRRVDVERAVRIRHLVFAEGLTLAGVRRRFEQERPPVADPDLADLVGAGSTASAVDDRLRARVREIRVQLRTLLERLEGGRPFAALRAAAAPGRTEAAESAVGVSPSDFELAAPSSAPGPDVAAEGATPERKSRSARRRKSGGGADLEVARALPVEPSDT
jgi:DNA-binding transcriptional MerR regulator